MKKETEENIRKRLEHLFLLVINIVFVAIFYEWKGFEFAVLMALVSILTKLDRK